MKNLAPEYFDNIDELTEVFSRKKMLLDLKDKKFKLMYLLNIDDFSSINTVYGLAIGDYVLKNIGNRLKSIDIDIYFRAYRIASDEFAILVFEKMRNLKNVRSVGSKIVSFVSQDIDLIGNNTLAISVTCGASFGEDDILRKAQIALKVARKNNLVLSLYKESYKIIPLKKQSKMEEIVKYRNAIINGELLIHYQPIVCNESNKKTKYEALCRIKYDNKIFYPTSFIALSKKLKLYNKLSLDIVEKAINDFVYRDEKVSINISIEDIHNRNFTSNVLRIANKYKKLDNVVFEITESSSIKNYTIINKFLKKMSPFGISISLDDFGTEYSNFTHISQIQADYLKIDGVFIRDINKNEKNYKLVSSIVGLCKELGIKTVAEYVTNEKILKTIKKIGVDYSQGFYFGEAIPIEEIKKEKK